MDNKGSPDPGKAIIEELIKGRDLSNQLLQLFVHHGLGSSHNFGDEISLLVPFAQHLLNNILTSFTNTLLLLNSNIHIPISPPRKSKDDLDLDDDDTVKSFNTRNGRGSYQRKRAMRTWEKKSPILVDDGYAWRKYGQKKTVDAKYQRNYYRCSHKDDQSCPAMKQVQRIQEKPPLYRTTYFGIHTCKNKLLPQIPLDYSLPSESSLLLSFNNNTSLPEKRDHPYFSTTKKEEEISSTDHHIDVKQNPPVSQFEHITTGLSSTLHRFSSVKAQSIEVEVDDAILRCFELDESARFGP